MALSDYCSPICSATISRRRSNSSMLLRGLHNFLNKTGSNPETDWQAMRNEAAAIRSREVEVNSSILYAVQDQSARRKAIAEFMWDDFNEYMSLGEEFENVDH
jgi:hypothetical protein